MKKKTISLLLSLVLSTAMFAGCGGSTKDSAGKNEKVKLSIFSSQNGEEEKNLEEVIKGFEKENPNVEIEITAPGSNYEQLMKSKMAANDLPDLWTTHGWSTRRYSSYLEPLNKESWAKNLNPAIKSVITDSKDNFYVLPLDVDQSGVVYNKEVLKKLNLEVPKTWDEFFKACEKIKSSGVTPTYLGCKDTWVAGNFFDWVAPSFLITNEKENYKDALKDGKMDWSKWGNVEEVLIKLRDNQYLNTDALTSDYMTEVKNLSEGKVAFAFLSSSAVQEAMKINPKANLGIMPVPAASAEDEATFISGEHTTLGVWKDSKHKKEALQLLNYLAKKENMSKVASFNHLPAGLKGVESDLGTIKEDFKKYENCRAFPYFDREYLPNGMWDSLCENAIGLISKKMTKQQGIDRMKEDYNRLREQK